MPWKSFKDGEEFCVYKLDGDGNKTGDTLGCHATEKEASDQIAALNANVEDGEMMEDDERARGLFETFWHGLKSLFRQARPEKARAISIADLFERVWGKLYEQTEINGEWAYPVDIYHDNGQMYLIAANEGRLFRYDITMTGDEPALGEPMEVAVQHNPVTTRTVIRKQADGKYRWVSRSATAALNRVGEIDSRALFGSFVAHVEETGKYPIRQFYHQGTQFRTGQADFVAVDGNVLITSGLYDDTLLAQKEREAIENDPAYWGESIGYLPTEAPEMAEVAEGIRIPVYRAGILREISTLPEEQAANLFTTIHQMEVQRMLTGKVKEAFVKLFGNDETAADKWLEENVDELNRSIQESGLVTRDKPETLPDATTGAPVFELDDAAIDAVVARLMEGDTAGPVIQRAMEHEVVTTLRAAVAEMATTIDDLQSRLAALEADETDKKRTWQDDLPASNANGKVKVTYRPRMAHQESQDGEPMSKRAAAVRPKNAY